VFGASRGCYLSALDLCGSDVDEEFVEAEREIELLLGDAAKGRHLVSDTGVGEENIDAPFLLCDLRVEAIEAGYVARYSDNVAADLRDRCIEFFLPSSRDVDVCAFGGELFRGGEAYAAAAACDDCDLAHVISTFFLFCTAAVLAFQPSWG
jgi:hypothetical protein